MIVSRTTGRADCENVYEIALKQSAIKKISFINLWDMVIPSCVIDKMSSVL